MRCGGLVEAKLADVSQLSVDRIDARLVGDAKQVSVAHGEDDHIAGIFRGELGGGEIMLAGDVVLQRRNIQHVLRKIRAEVDDLERVR